MAKGIGKTDRKLAKDHSKTPASQKLKIADPYDLAVTKVKKFIDQGMSDNSIWAELEAIGLNRAVLGPRFVTDIRQGNTPKRKVPHQSWR